MVFSRQVVAICFASLIASASAAAQRIQVEEPGRWQPILESLSLEATTAPAQRTIIIGEHPRAESVGIRATLETITVASLVDEHDPELEILWQEPLTLPIYELPAGAQLHTWEKHSRAPLAASVGNLLWLAAEPGDRGYERYPYLAQAIVRDQANGELAQPRLLGNRLWVFLDTSYRNRADPAYLARRWRRGGVAAVHVAAWHFHEPDSSRDRYLANLIKAWHREGVLAYAWLELPHVSDGFWSRYPGCREKTASGADARLDWRKLVNLADPHCFELAAKEVDHLLTRFDWDGVNLAELYFESLHGPSNPARFTPMNGWVRADAERKLGFNPTDLFDDNCERHWSRSPKQWGEFADYRAKLALDLQARLIRRVAGVVPGADIVVTQIDDRFDTRMREYLGADTAALIPLAKQLDFTIAIEDPATIWNLGPQRYSEIGRRYAELTTDASRLAIDINIVERYQQVYPTRKQVGVELFQLVHAASEAFHRVLLYFEHSISRPDWPLLPHSAATGNFDPSTGIVDSKHPVGLRHKGSATVNGKPWPVLNGETVWLPAGNHQVRASELESGPRVLSFTGDLLAAEIDSETILLRYHSRSRAIARLDTRPGQVLIDEKPYSAIVLTAKSYFTVMLPRGSHTVSFGFDALIR